MLLIHQILNSCKPKAYYSDAKHEFYIKSHTLVLRPLLYFQKNYERSNKLEKFSIKDDS